MKAPNYLKGGNLRSNLRSRIRDYIRSEIRGYISGLNLNDYNFYCSFKKGAIPADKVSRTLMQSTGLAAGRVSYHGGPYAVNEPAIDKNGLFSCPAFVQYLYNIEDFSSDHWDVQSNVVLTPNAAIAPDGTLTAIKYSLLGSTLRAVNHVVPPLSCDITASVWVKAIVDTSIYFRSTLDGEIFTKNILVSDGWLRVNGTLAVDYDSYTLYGFYDISGGIGDRFYFWLPNITDTPILMPCVHNDTNAPIAIPENFSDVDQGYKFSINAQLLTALNGTDATDAQGKLTVKWRPMFNYDQISSSNLNIMSATDAIMSLLYSTNTGSIMSNDGTTLVSTNIGYQADTEYTITLQYGSHPGYADTLKMQLSITDGTTTWQSGVVDFDGSFNPADYLSFFFGAEYPQYVKELSIEREVGWE